MRYQSRSETQKLLIRIFFLLLSIVCILNDNIQIISLSLYVTILCFVLMILAYYEKKRIVSEYTIILAFIILFHFGQSIIFIFEPKRYLPAITEFSKIHVIKALKYSMICLQVFDITFSIYHPIIERKVKYVRSCSQNYLNTADFVSKISLIILTPVVLISLLAKTTFSL